MPPPARGRERISKRSSGPLQRAASKAREGANGGHSLTDWRKRYMKVIVYILLLLVTAISAAAQPDKRDVRRGNRDYKKENWKEAEIEYRKGIVKDSLSVAANYNLAADLYRQNNPQEAQKVLDRIKEVAPATENAADYYYNLGDVAIANQDWQTAVTAFEESLLRNPGDMNAKENYIYAKKKLQQQQNQQQNQDNQNQNQDRNDQNTCIHCARQTPNWGRGCIGHITAGVLCWLVPALPLIRTACTHYSRLCMQTLSTSLSVSVRSAGVLALHPSPTV